MRTEGHQLLLAELLRIVWPGSSLLGKVKKLENSRSTKLVDYLDRWEHHFVVLRYIHVALSVGICCRYTLLPMLCQGRMQRRLNILPVVGTRIHEFPQPWVVLPPGPEYVYSALNNMDFIMRLALLSVSAFQRIEPLHRKC